MPGNLALLDQLVDSTCWTSISMLHGRGYQRQSQKNADAPAAHFLEGKILAAEGKWDSAEAELQKTLQLDPNFVRRL